MQFKKIWAYWSARNTPLDAAVSHTWDRLTVVTDGGRLELRPHPYTYRLIRGEDLQAHVSRLLERAGGFTPRRRRRHAWLDAVLLDVVATVPPAPFLRAALPRLPRLSRRRGRPSRRDSDDDVAGG